MHCQPIELGSTIRGSTLPEAVEVLSVVPLAGSLKVVGIGRRTGRTHVSVLSRQQLAVLTVSAKHEPFDADASLFRLGIEAHQLGLAPCQVSAGIFRSIVESGLEGLVPPELNLSADNSKLVAADDQGPTPEVAERFFMEAAPDSGIQLDEIAEGSHCYRVEVVSHRLHAIGKKQADRYGGIGRRYAKVVFAKEYLAGEPTQELLTLGHSLFEAVRTDALGRAEDHLLRGAIFYDRHRIQPALLDIFAASVKDGCGVTLNRRLFATETSVSGDMTSTDLACLRDMIPAPAGATGPAETMSIPARQRVAQLVYQRVLRDWGESAENERRDDVDRISRYVEISLSSQIDRQQAILDRLMSRGHKEDGVCDLDRLIGEAEQCLEFLKTQLDRLTRELDRHRHCGTTDVAHLGRAWVAPHPERASS